MKKAKEKMGSCRIQKIVDDQSGPRPPFLAITKNEGQGPLSSHHVKASTPRGLMKRKDDENIGKKRRKIWGKKK